MFSCHAELIRRSSWSRASIVRSNSSCGAHQDEEQQQVPSPSPISHGTRNAACSGSMPKINAFGAYLALLADAFLAALFVVLDAFAERFDHLLLLLDMLEAVPTQSAHPLLLLVASSLFFSLCLWLPEPLTPDLPSPRPHPPPKRPRAGHWNRPISTASTRRPPRAMRARTCL